MATDYDSLDANFTSKIQMEASEFAMSSMPGQGMMHPIECARRETALPVLYLRTNTVPAGSDQRLYDLGNFQIATSGIPNNTNAQTLGELWVSYDISLLKPVLGGGLVGNNVISWKWRLPIANVASAGTAYFGTTAATLSPGSSLNAPTLSNAGVMTFPNGMVGSYLLLYAVVGGSTALSNAMANSTVGFSSSNVFIADTASGLRQTAGATATIQWFQQYLTFSAPSTAATNFTFTAGTLPTAITGADLWLQQVNPNIIT